MKKSYLLILIVLIVIAISAFFKIKNLQIDKQAIINYNKEFESYNVDSLNGLDITTLINKSISNNEKNNVIKNNEGYYVLDDENSIEIYIKINKNDTIYKMESFNKRGLNDFVKSFATASFKCIDIQYHEKSGKVSSMTFECLSY